MSGDELKLGVIGLNEGNGHPYSYSAIFNGYDPEELQHSCPFQLIKEYLPRDHRNEVFLPGAKVTHIWTQDPALSESVARVSRIPHIVPRMEDLVGVVDAVILARDDPWNHLSMARPFLEARVPLFVDKQLAASVEDCAAILAAAKPGQVLMAGSPARYTRDLERARGMLQGKTVRSIHGMSRVTWMRYGHHLLEPIVALFGVDVDWVRSLSERDGHDIVQIRYRSGMNVMLEFVDTVHLPIEFQVYTDEAEPVTVPFADFFHGFREMLQAFVTYVRTGQEPFPSTEMLDIAKVVLAGDISKRSGGEPVRPQDLHLS